MTFKKPFRAKPVKLGPYWKQEQRRKSVRQIVRIAVFTLLVFLVGMAVTNWETYQPSVPVSAVSVYYPNCDSARAAGAAPLRRESPGYRSALDADGDGIACEPYFGN